MGRVPVGSVPLVAIVLRVVEVGGRRDALGAQVDHFVLIFLLIFCYFLDLKCSNDLLKKLMMNDELSSLLHQNFTFLH